MKTSFWHRWCQSVLGARPPGRVSRGGRRHARLYLETLEDRVTPSLTPQMVLDINTNSLSSNPSEMVAVGSTTYFTADDGVHGVELWKSDGTEAGTVLVKDINPGSGGSNPRSLTNVNGTLFFTADDGTHGPELWKSDGTAAGTTLVKDIFANSGGSGPYLLTNVNGTLFFSAYTSPTGWELWKSDGTAAGTVLVKDVVPGWDGSYPRDLTNVNGTLFFASHDYFGTYSELWKSDGTAAGTVLVKSFTPKPNVNDAPSNLTNVDGTLYFSAYTAAHGSELWKSDGTTAGTTLVQDIVPGSNGFYPSSLTNVNGTLFFSTVTGTGLWKSDGTAAGTTLVKDVYYPSRLTNLNGTLFFTADDGTHGRELWKSNGTSAGTVMVKDINPSNIASGPYNLTSVNGTLYFTVSHTNVNGTPSFNNASELWKSDGTEAGTALVKDFHSSSAYYGSPRSLTNVNGTLMFAADDGRHGVELWQSDGTAVGTALVKDIHTSTLSSYPTNFTDVNGTLFFAANDGIHGSELWKSDGTVAGTTLVKDIYPGSGWIGNVHYGYSYQVNSSNPANLTAVQGTLFFTTWSAGTGSELWKSDGTEAGTVLVSRVWASNLTAVNGTLFFTASGSDGYELWKSDGTLAGTTLVKDIHPGSSWVYHGGYYGGWWEYVPNSSSPSNLTNVNGTLFFTANDGEHGLELWKSDGTAAGTVLVNDIWPGSANNNYGPSHLTEVNGTLFFSANDGTHGYELWKSDGTEAGTTLVKDISPGSYWSVPHNLMNVDGTLFFVAHTAATGYELWKSDGTEAGTVLVKDIRPGSGNSYPGDHLRPWLGNWAVVNGTLFFHANDGTHGRELWKSDGTEAGTVLVKDIYPGLGTNYTGPTNLTEVNGTLFFTAYDGSEQRKLWMSDGTQEGTALVADLFASSLTNVNGTLFFSADDGIHGRELWALTNGSVQGPTLAVSGFAATVTAGEAGSFTVTAKNADGTTDTTYRGTVHFTSSDAQAVLPADYTFTAADNGTHTFTVTLKTAGTQSLTVTDTTAGFSGRQTGITVNPAAASSFALADFPSTSTSGVSGSFRITAYDAYGNRATSYTGTVRFTSSDAVATLPADYTFTASNNGTASFSAALATAGTQSITVTDTANSSATSTQAGIRVVPLATVSGPSYAARNQTLSFTLGASGGSSYRFDIDWNNDGIVDQTVSGPSGTTVNHTYASSGYYTVAVTATATVGGQVYTSRPAYQSVNVLAVSVTIQADPGDATRKALVVEGTAAAETLVLSPGTGNGVALTYSGHSLGTLNTSDGAAFGRVLVYGYGGDDTIQLTGGLAVPSLLFGGDGNDTFDARGSVANNVLVGGAGADALYGGSGRDLLIGGLGADTLRGGGGDDILVGGYTDYDANLAALLAVMKEWGRTDADYSTRVKHLSGTLGGGLNGSYLLKTTTVHDDNAIDSLYGEAGLDWFFARNKGKTKDKVIDLSTGEVATAIA